MSLMTSPTFDSNIGIASPDTSAESYSPLLGQGSGGVSEYQNLAQQGYKQVGEQYLSALPQNYAPYLTRSKNNKVWGKGIDFGGDYSTDNAAWRAYSDPGVHTLLNDPRDERYVPLDLPNKYKDFFGPASMSWLTQHDDALPAWARDLAKPPSDIFTDQMSQDAEGTPLPVKAFNSAYADRYAPAEFYGSALPKGMSYVMDYPINTPQINGAQFVQGARDYAFRPQAVQEWGRSPAATRPGSGNHYFVAPPGVGLGNGIPYLQNPDRSDKGWFSTLAQAALPILGTALGGPLGGAFGSFAAMGFQDELPDLNPFQVALPFLSAGLGGSAGIGKALGLDPTLVSAGLGGLSSYVGGGDPLAGAALGGLGALGGKAGVPGWAGAAAGTGLKLSKQQQARKKAQQQQRA